jgi:putative transposase
LDFLPEEWRLIRRDGIQMFNIHYWDNVLSPLAGRSSKPVLIKYDPRNLSRVFYRDKDGHYWPIPYRNLGAPPISLWEQREAMKRLRTEGRRLVDERLIFETALAQRKLVDSARKSTTRKRRNNERLQHLQATSSNTRVASDSAQTFGANEMFATSSSIHHVQGSWEKVVFFSRLNEWDRLSDP